MMEKKGIHKDAAKESKSEENNTDAKRTRQFLEFTFQNNMWTYVLWYWYVDDFGMLTTDFEYSTLFLHLTMHSFLLGMIHYTQEYIKNIIMVQMNQLQATQSKSSEGQKELE